VGEVSCLFRTDYGFLFCEEMNDGTQDEIGCGRQLGSSVVRQRREKKINILNK